MAIKASTLGGGSSGFATNDFTINVGSSGYTSVPLATSFPTGSYICTSSLSDTTLDIYLINEDGTSAGYANATTANTTITASKSFNKVIIYGAASNDTLTFQFKYVFAPTGASSTDFLGAPPKIVSISDSDLQNIDDTTTITGFNFAEDIEVTFTGTGYSATAAKSIVRASSTSLVVTRPDNFPTTGSPYTITVTNPGIASPTSTSSHILASSVTAGNAPVWVTSATLNNYRKSEAFSQTIQATDSDGGSSVTYSVISGSLPTGISFNSSTGTFSGTPTQNTGTPYTYTVRATDSGGNYVNRAFTLSQVAPDAPTSPIGTDVGTSRAFNNGAVSVSFTAPSYTGTSSITSYTVTASTGQTASGSSSPIIVTGIATGATPTFTVTATNTGGTSLSSGASSSVTVTTVPEAPTVGTASITNSTTVSIPFTAGATGGKTISSYVAASSPSISLSTSGTSSPLTATGSYAQGQSYTFAIAAVNQNGTSSYSSYSNGIVPLQLSTVSGGVLTSDSTYYYRTFTGNGSLVVSTSAIAVNAIIVGGGGSGGYSARETDPTYGTYMVRAGGGGAGGLIETSPTISPGTYSIVVGAGGVYNTNNGSSSSFNGNTALGGGYGHYSTAASGGSGGGAGAITASGFGSYTAGSGTAGQGNAGANGTLNNGGGGGGKGSAGSGTTGGSGALYSAFTGATGTGSGGYYAGGGAGTTGTGGSGGGGNSVSGSVGANGGTYTGGGGGGGGYTSTSSDGTRAGGNGGSGVVIVRYLRSAVGG